MLLVGCCIRKVISLQNIHLSLEHLNRLKAVVVVVVVMKIPSGAAYMGGQM